MELPVTQPTPSCQMRSTLGLPRSGSLKTRWESARTRKPRPQPCRSDMQMPRWTSRACSMLQGLLRTRNIADCHDRSREPPISICHLIIAKARNRMRLANGGDNRLMRYKRTLSPQLAPSVLHLTSKRFANDILPTSLPTLQLAVTCF